MVLLQSGNGKNVHSGHRSRVREKIKNGALENMHDHEIMEYLLFHTVAYRDTNELAHRLIDHFGSFHAVLDAKYDDLLLVEGVSEVTATFLSSLPTVFKRYGEDLTRLTKLKNIADITGYMKNKFIGETVEKVYMLCLDGNMNVIKCELVCTGNSHEVQVENRTIMEVAIRSNAENIIIVHNHPNGVAKPSADDIESAYFVKKMLGEVGIRLVDSVIIAGNEALSLANNEKYRDMF